MAKKKLQRIACLTISLLALTLGACASLKLPGEGSRDQGPESSVADAIGEAPVKQGGERNVKAASNDESRDNQGHGDLWDRIRDGFRFEDLNSSHTDDYVRWYSERPEYIERMTERASMYLFYIVEELERHDFPMEIALLPAIESSYKPRAYSRAHAVGLWQFISATGRRYGLKQNWWYDGRRDVIEATRAAIAYLDFLHDEFNGDWFHALASYNGGERRVQSAIDSNRNRGKPTDYAHLNLRRETMRYIPKLLAIKRIIQNPERYGVKLAPVPNRPYFDVVELNSQIDLGIVADAAGISMEQLHDLNAGYRRWATDPDGPHRILVPVDRKDQVVAGLGKLPVSQRMRWARYSIRPGDTLSGIARRYGVSVTALQSSNRLRGSTIRAGKTLLVPLSAASVASSAYAQQSGQPVVHRVERGDTLWGIARRYKVHIKQLQHWNEIATQDVLRLGQKIMVYLN